MSPWEQCQARRILQLCPKIELEPNETRAADTLPPTKLFLVESGIALLTSERSGWRRPIVLSVAGPGAVLPPLAPGEHLAGLTAARVRPVSAAAQSDLLALPGVAELIVAGLIEALRERQDSLTIATGCSHAERLRAKLVQLARRHGRVCPGGVEIALPLTPDLLARMIGSARETVTCTLGQFERDGFVVRGGRNYRLKLER